MLIAILIISIHRMLLALKNVQIVKITPPQALTTQSKKFPPAKVPIPPHQNWGGIHPLPHPLPLFGKPCCETWNCEDFICKTFSTTTGAVDSFPTCITIDRDEFEIVSEFCYLGDVIEQTGDCTDAVTVRIGLAWKCMEVKPGSCLQKTCHKLKNETIQLFVASAMLR